MSELSVTLLRLGFLLLLWLLVLSAIGVLRRDLYGTAIVDRRRPGGRGRAAGTAAGGGPGAPAPPTEGPTRLVVTAGPLAGTTLPLGSSAVLVGRSPSCTLVLDDDYSSSRHARFFPQGGQWYVEDLGSTNGTMLGDQRVGDPQPVPSGVPVRIGQSLIELRR